MQVSVTSSQLSFMVEDATGAELDAIAAKGIMIQKVEPTGTTGKATFKATVCVLVGNKENAAEGLRALGIIK